jgi:hypothetical protein
MTALTCTYDHHRFQEFSTCIAMDRISGNSIGGIRTTQRIGRYSLFSPQAIDHAMFWSSQIMHVKTIKRIKRVVVHVSYVWTKSDKSISGKSQELYVGIADQTESRLDPVEPRGLGSESDRGHNPFLNRRESNRRESCSHDRLHSTRVPSQEGHAMTLPCLSAW